MTVRKLPLEQKLIAIAVFSILVVLFLRHSHVLQALFLILVFSVLFIVIRADSMEKLKKLQSAISELKKSNFKFRSPIFGRDLHSLLLNDINIALENTEKIIESKQDLERSKLRWLQELAHDLRTPLATLEVLHMSIIENMDTIEKSKMKELLGDSANETQYLKNLVDDMLLLALMEDPSYFARKEPINLPKAIHDIFQKFDSKFQKNNKTIKLNVNKDIPEKLNTNPKLFDRLLHNCINNALLYSSSQATFSASFEHHQNHLYLSFSNDGSPFSDLQILQFGKDREAQKRESSLGLGSVIISRAVSMMGASLSVKNVKNESGQVLPTLEIVIPYS